MSEDQKDMFDTIRELYEDQDNGAEKRRYTSVYSRSSTA